MFAKAPTLAWLLTALACFLTGMAVVEGRPLTPMRSAHPPAGVVVTYEIVYRPADTPVPTPRSTVAPTATPCDPTGPAAPRFGCAGNA